MVNRNFFLLLLITVCTGCSSVNSMLGGNTAKEAITDVKYSADPRGVIMDVHSTQNLNGYDGLAHALAVVIVQATNPKALFKLAQSE